MLHSSVVSFNSNRNADSNRLNVNGNNWNDNNNGYGFGMAQAAKTSSMKTYKNLYKQICSLDNLFLAFHKARKGKTKKIYVIKFEKDLRKNLLELQHELKTQTYKPLPLTTFILRDPKTRKISKSDFRDRIIHHAIVNILEPIFDRTFIHDSYANRKGKGNLFALKRFHSFIKKVSQNGKTKGKFNNNQVKGYCLKADIKHYFEEINHKILISLLKKKIADDKTINLIEKIVTPNVSSRESNEKGMPLGNLTSQFFANIYLNELDYFVKHKLNAKYYIRYVDDFVILSNSKEQLRAWKNKIIFFLKTKLKIELHPDKSKIISLSKGIDFVGLRNFYYFKLLRKRNIRKINQRITKFRRNKISHLQICEIYQGWQAYSKWANTFKLRKSIIIKIAKANALNLKTPISLIK